MKIARRNGVLASLAVLLSEQSLLSSANALSRTYLIFFAQGETDPKDRGRDILRECVRNAASVRAGRTSLFKNRPPISGATVYQHIVGQASDGGPTEACYSLARARAFVVGRLSLAFETPAEYLRAWSAGPHLPIVPNDPLIPQNRLTHLWFTETPDFPVQFVPNPVRTLIRPVPLD